MKSSDYSELEGNGDLMGPFFLSWSLSVAPGIPGGLPVIADWLLAQPSSFSSGAHKESTFPVAEFWPTACEWGSVYSKSAKMGSPWPNPLSFITLIHHGERKHLIPLKDDPDAFPHPLRPGWCCILYTRSDLWHFLKCRSQRRKGRTWFSLDWAAFSAVRNLDSKTVLWLTLEEAAKIPKVFKIPELSFNSPSERTKPH